MKVFNYVHIKNMYAHKDTRIDFSEGKNYIIGPIGSGKTEVLQALGFAMFGTVALRDKATSYKNIYIELSFNYKGETFIIKRKINDASLLILDKNTNSFEEIVNSTSIVNQKIISLLGYNYDIFLLSNFCQQKKLSYFSDLTPAKRLQYIDKISGIEEAKELLKYLNTKRKTLKDNILLLKDVTIEPKLNANIDLSFDYESNINVLNSRLNSVNDLYSNYSNLLTQISNRYVKPTLQLTNIDKLYLELSEIDRARCIEYLQTVTYLASDAYDIKNKLQDIPRINSKFKHLTLEDVNQYILNYNFNVIHSVAKDVKIVCSSCNQEQDLTPLLNPPVISDINFDIKDLYNLQSYLISGYNVIREELEGTLKSIEDQLDDLEDNQFKPNLLSFTVDQFKAKLANIDITYQTYLNDCSLYEEQEEHNNKINEQAVELKDNIDSIIRTQTLDIQLKDNYIQYNTEKNLYLEQYILYDQAKDKIDKFKIELDLINNLIKDITRDTNSIKNQTIPLINYHASYFLNLITKGKMSNIEITDDFDLIVDGFKIAVRSGGQQDLASLSFRLSLSQSLINGILHLQ